jgi:ParB/RepB/Spo0J family partition protein
LRHRGEKVTTAIKLQDVPLGRIDLDDAALEMVPASDLDRLKVSLTESGLLNPPWLRPQPGKHRWEVVTGTRRLQAAAALGWQEITARLLPENSSDFYCLLVHLMDNAFTRGFNLWEQATLAARLLQHSDKDTVASKYLPYLGLPPSQAHLTRLIKTTTLKAPWPRLAAQGRLALTAAAVLADWDPEDRAAAWPFLAGLRLSQSKQEEFLEQVALLARREGLTPAGVLAKEELRQALGDPDRTPQEKTEAVRRHLFHWFYPRLSAAREAFETAAGKLGWKRTTRIRLYPPAMFEAPDYHLEIKFRDAPELQQLLAEIARLAQQEDFAGLTRS